MSSRFVPVETIINDRVLNNILLISDYVFWDHNESTITEWLEDHHVIWKRTGSFISFGSPKMMSFFLLRWS